MAAVTTANHSSGAGGYRVTSDAATSSPATQGHQTTAAAASASGPGCQLASPVSSASRIVSGVRAPVLTSCATITLS